MLDILKDKEVIFFDVGYTLDYPASGDWMFTNKFYELAGDKMSKRSETEIQRAREKAMIYLSNNHLVIGEENEYQQFRRYYAEISEHLQLNLTQAEIDVIADDRTNNMKNYILYEDAIKVLEIFHKTHKLGIISDTWPSITKQLKAIGIYDYFSSYTYSCDLGVFKPDEKMYLDALGKMGCRPEKAVFIDDTVKNLDGAAKLGITPILIAANPASDVETKYQKIHSLLDLL